MRNQEKISVVAIGKILDYTKLSQDKFIKEMIFIFFLFITFNLKDSLITSVFASLRLWKFTKVPFPRKHVLKMVIFIVNSSLYLVLVFNCKVFYYNFHMKPLKTFLLIF